MRRVVVTLAALWTLTALEAADVGDRGSLEPTDWSVGSAAFGGYFTVDAPTGEMVQSRSLRGGQNVYTNLSPPGTNNVVFGLTDLDTVFGDQLSATGTGVINELALTVYNSDAGNHDPILTMNLQVTVHRDANNSLLGMFTGSVDFGAGVPPGAYAIVTFTNLDMLPTAIITDTTAIRVEQQRLSHTGGSNRMGVASLVPIQIGGSPDTMLLNGAVFPFSVPLNPGYRVSVIPRCPGDLDSDGSVALGDLSILLSNFGTTAGATPEDGDLDGDGDVDLADLSLMLANFGAICI